MGKASLSRSAGSGLGRLLSCSNKVMRDSGRSGDRAIDVGSLDPPQPGSSDRYAGRAVGRDSIAELKRLRRESEILRQEREILKRATTFSPRREVDELLPRRSARRRNSPLTGSAKFSASAKAAYVVWKSPRQSATARGHDSAGACPVRPFCVKRNLWQSAHDTLRKAVAMRRPSKGLIHYSDRASQYCSIDYQAELRRHDVCISMSGKGDCYDNAMVETFLKTLKSEPVWRTAFHTRAQAKTAIAGYRRVLKSDPATLVA